MITTLGSLDELIRQRNKGKELEEKLAQYAAARVDAEVAQLRVERQGLTFSTRSNWWLVHCLLMSFGNNKRSTTSMRLTVSLSVLRN